MCAQSAVAYLSLPVLVSTLDCYTCSRLAKVLKRKARPRVGEPHEIPQRELRNDISRVLAAVARGERFRVTVRGRPVAEIVPTTSRRTAVPWPEVMELIRRTPLDKRFMADVDGAVDNRVRDPWKRS